jgi:hypothetical protein
MQSHTKKIFVAASLAALLGSTGCKKYEDGPSLSLASKKARLTGEWEVDEIANDPITDGDIVLEFESNGDFSFTYEYGTYSYSYSGDWEWGNSKESVEVTIDGFKSEWEILRLTNQEFWFEDEDNDEWQCEKR